MKKLTINNKSVVTLISAILVSITLSACDSDNDAKALSIGVEKEVQKQNGTYIETVTINDGDQRLTAGETLQLSATGADSNGDERDVTSELTWSSSDEAIATVDSNGLVTAVASSSVNNGIVTISGTTIFDIVGEGFVSVSDAAISSISLRQITPENGNIKTCIAAKIAADVTYEDGYESKNTTKDVSFTLTESETAAIDDDGNLYTSSELVEDILITGEIESFGDELQVTADPSNLASVYFFVDEESVNISALEVGGRAQVNAEALNNDDTTVYDIDNSIQWTVEDSSILGVTTSGDAKGALVALKTGVTSLVGQCGGLSSSVTVTVTGDDDIDELSINDAIDEVTLTAGDSLALTSTVLFESETTLNVSEFATWSLNGSELLTAELLDTGTDEASFTITSTEDDTGAAVVSVTYDGESASITINIE